MNTPVLIEIVLMWVCLAVAYGVVMRWPMGIESDRRQGYWAKYEQKKP